MDERFPRVRIELRPSRLDIGGVGVFAADDISNGEKIANGLEEEDFQNIVPWKSFSSFDAELQRKIMAFCVGTPDGFIPPPDFDFNKLSIEWYLNHSCDGNCGFDDDGDFAAIRSVKKGEELAYDYALVESNPQFCMTCRCESRICRHLITGDDWKNEGFQIKNHDYMHPHLRRLAPIPVLR